MPRKLKGLERFESWQNRSPEQGPDSGKSFKNLLSWAHTQFEFLDKNQARQEIERLFEEVTGLRKTDLYLEPERSFSRDEVNRFRAFVSKRKERMPLAYVLNKAPFYNEELEVNEHVLIPRPETEILVERFIERSGFRKEDSFRFLDLGSGSGAIAVAVLRHFKNAQATCSDISTDALSVTRKNLISYNLDGRAEIIHSDLFENLGQRQWDAILSNPPYVAPEEFTGLEPEIFYEPRLALAGGDDGYSFYRRIIHQTPVYLKKGGWLIVEMGASQAQRVENWLGAENFEKIQIFRDYCGKDRVAMAQYNL